MSLLQCVIHVTRYVLDNTFTLTLFPKTSNFKTNKKSVGCVELEYKLCVPRGGHFILPTPIEDEKFVQIIYMLHRTYNLKIARNLRFLQINIRP